MTTKLKLILLFTVPALTLPVVAEKFLPTIEWQTQSLRLIVESGCYARMIRLKNREILCCYQRSGQCWVKRSCNEGRTWIGETRVTTCNKGVAADPEILQLEDGRIMLCYNGQPDEPESHYTIMAVFSDDNGQRWSRAACVFEAGRTLSEGCWQPAAVRYPDGEIQIMFANEAPHTYSRDQEIAVVSSKDNGRSWQPPKTLAYRSDHRDGAPVPCLLRDGRSIVLAIEDNGVNGATKPVILRDTLQRRWQRAIITGSSSQREPALSNPLSEDVYAGAPYICQMPSGITILAIQSRERRALEEPAVYVGDAQARKFTNRTFPFNLKPGIEGSWNALFVKNADTVTLVSTTELNGKRGIWAIDGKIWR